MLSDFDLAKQSTEPGGLPVMIQSDMNGVGLMTTFACDNYNPR
jgi:protein-serine/threonine kinase